MNAHYECNYRDAMNKGVPNNAPLQKKVQAIMAQWGKATKNLERL